MAGSTGVLPPPKGYLKRLREICAKHGILLIFDEVITGFGRLGRRFAAERFGVMPDMITFAKGVTNGAVPMGGVIVRKDIYDAFMTGPEHVVELFHGYTYSGHPLAAAAAPRHARHLQRRGPVRARRRARGAMGRRGHDAEGPPNVVDIRTSGWSPASTSRRSPARRGARLRGDGMRLPRARLMMRITGDTIALSPPLIISRAQIDEIFSKRLPAVLDAVR